MARPDWNCSKNGTAVRTWVGFIETGFSVQLLIIGWPTSSGEW